MNGWTSTRNMHGWSNRQTWIVSIWDFSEFDVSEVQDIINDKGLSEYNKILCIADSIRANFISHVNDLYPDLMYGHNAVNHLFSHAVGLVDWQELAEHWYELNVGDLPE